MKRLEVIVNIDKVNNVINVINEVGVGGMTVMHARGLGATDPPLVGKLYSRKVIVTVVDDSKVDNLKTAIMNAVCTKSKGDGKIFITNVENAVDICTSNTGKNAI